MSKRLLFGAGVVGIALSLASFEAQAISRYESTSMTCAAVKSTVRGEGAVILRWMSTKNPGLPRYSRYVRSSSYCDPGKVAVTAYVPSADTRSCRVKRCKRVDRDEFPFFFRFHRR